MSRELVLLDNHTPFDTPPQKEQLYGQSHHMEVRHRVLMPLLITIPERLCIRAVACSMSHVAEVAEVNLEARVVNVQGIWRCRKSE